jgi:hypothetical protein
MPLIISKNRKDAVKVDPSSFEDEANLQAYIYDNPESIPLYEIKEDIRFLILAREFPTDSGPIDAIGVDKDGDLYIIETKLYKNPDKRLVVAQVLDYGASLWRSGYEFSDFTTILNHKVQEKFNLSLKEKLAQYFNFSEEETEQHLERLRRNLNEGNFKFVVLMDELHSALKDLIVFLNENSKFDVYAVEIEYYKHDTYEILIPKLFGAEVKKDIRVTGSARSSKLWNEASFFNDAKQHLNQQELAVVEELYRFLKSNFQLRFGAGATRGSFTAQLNYKETSISLLEVTAKGKIQFFINSLLKRGIPTGEVRNLINSLIGIDPSFAVEGDLAHSYSVSRASNLTEPEKLQTFKKVVSNFQEQRSKS